MGKVTEFDGSVCWFKNSDGKVVAMATRCGSLYFLDCQPCEQANVVGSKEDLWHKRYGHLGYDSLRRLAVERLVDGLSLIVGDRSASARLVLKGNTTKVPSQLVVVRELLRLWIWCILMSVES